MKIKEVLLGVIIGVVLLMFLVFGSKLVYEKPEYVDYCDYGDKFINYSNEVIIAEHNEYLRTCGDNFDEANEDYSKKMFVLGLIVGILIIVGSAIFININSISGGLMFGSLMFIIYGTGSYWRYMNDWTRFIILGIALGILIYLGYWLGNKGKKKVKRKSIKRK